jgi:excinuclease UvrABC nuclease subunit
MHLSLSTRFDANVEDNTLLESLASRPAVFALLFAEGEEGAAPPYLGRTTDLRRRLGRLLTSSGGISKLLNLREVTRRIEYQYVGSSFEAHWLLYRLNKFYYPRLYRQRLRLKSPALLKLNLRNRFPRCYPTRRLASDGSLYYGPFPSWLAAERFAAEFLDLFKIRRCVEELDPNPAHPGCIYSQMHLCLAPCFAGCTDDEYQQEVARVTAFLDTEGQALLRSLEAERAQAAEALEFELAAKLHRRLEKVHEVLRQRPGLVRNLLDLHAVLVLRGAEPQSVVFFRLSAGEVRGPATLSLNQDMPSPVPLDLQLHALLDPLAGPRNSAAALPPAEHLSLVARWYYSSFRQGEILMLPASQQIPHARLIRLCRKVLAETPRKTRPVL